MCEYVYELNLPPVEEVFIQNHGGFNDDHQQTNYLYITQLDQLLRPEWLNFNNISWDTILYFKKDCAVGDIHTDIGIEFLKNGLDAHCHPWGINWVWGGDCIFEYWNYCDVDNNFITNGANNNHVRGVVQTYTERSPPIKRYTLYRDRAYLVYGGLPHKATGLGNRKLISLRQINNQWHKWEKVVQQFSQYMRVSPHNQ